MGKDSGQARVPRLPYPSFPSTFRRAASGGAMDLAGLLLDEEGTFSLTGFQDFSVRARPASSPAFLCLSPGPRALLSGPERGRELA